MATDAAGEEGQVLVTRTPGMLYRRQPGMIRTLRRLLIFVVLSGITYFLIRGKRKARPAKLVSWSMEPIRSSPEELLELGQTCRVAGEHGVVHNRHAIVLDAGSTGSRVHVYEFQCCGDKLVMLADELFEEVKPGLSHFAGNPMGAAQSLLPLIKRALQRVPEFLHSCTPLVLKATAGLRLLPADLVKEILESVRSWLATHPFLLGELHDTAEGPVSVMDGSEEGVLAWVTVNFLNKRIGHQIDAGHMKDSSIVMDLGGGSTQIVFAVADPPKKAPNKFANAHPEYYYQLLFHGTTHHLYQHSYLGYGLMEARKAIKAHYIKSRWSAKHKFACLPAGYSMDHEGTMIEGDSGGFERCYGVVKGIFDIDKECPIKPCSFNGIHQPSFPLDRNGKPPSIVAFSYFYDRLIPLGLTSPMTLSQIGEAAAELCSARPGGTSLYSRLLTKNYEWCMDVVYMYALLAYAYKIDLDTPITVTKQIRGYEAGWALGSALKLLDQHRNTCPYPPPTHFLAGR